ncbi:hypothetical protein M3Y97_00005900 [Aphelenchoides bicaudatus]|nr:hypothetical protein M3Y97_00005900 [Aphelenchoides bicaudatus]
MALDATHCLCSMHVHSAARLIAIKSMMLAVFKFCFLLFQLLYLDNKERDQHGPLARAYNYLMRLYEKDHVTTVELVICVILAAVSLLLFYGNRQHKAKFYVPFILYSSFEAIQAIANLAFFIYSTYTAGYGELEESLQPIRKQLFTYCIVLTVIFAILYTLRTYIFLIVIAQAFVFLTKADGNVNMSRLSVPTNLNAAENKMLSDLSSNAHS